jgi:hypothetical protein
MLQPATYKVNSFLLSKIESLKVRIELLTGLKKVTTTSATQNISPSQWYAVNNQLQAIANKLLRQLNSCTDKFSPEGYNKKNQSLLINTLGEIELELSQAYNFYDTYIDILTQRLSPELGPLLKGCDAIAADGLKHSYLPNVTRNPIVYCNRGFGASILREGVSITKTANPVAFIAIPYSRLAEKYNLISIYHEVGHQALSKLNLVEGFKQAFASSAKRAGANALLQTMFANWSKEIVPDFWAFGHTGMGQTSSLRDILIVPQQMAFSASPYQQHPPPYLRFLISVEWCKYLWGRGDWDYWEEEWQSFYPDSQVDSVTKELIFQAKKILPNMARATIKTRFKKLNNKNMTSFFDLNSIGPNNLNKSMCYSHFRYQPIGIQLSAFRLMREKKNIPIKQLNIIMHNWLISLNN